MEREQRTTTQRPELRGGGTVGGDKIFGTAAVIYRAGDKSTEYELFPNAFERMMPRVFDNAMKRGDDIRALFNHDPNMILGRTKSRTAKVWADSIGLHYEVKPADTTVYRDVVEHMKRGDVDGSSFSFIVNDDHWRMENGREIREVRDVTLFDVSPVVFPAYSGASSGVRSSGTTERSSAMAGVCRSSFSQHLVKLAMTDRYERDDETLALIAKIRESLEICRRVAQRAGVNIADLELRERREHLQRINDRVTI